MYGWLSNIEEFLRYGQFGCRVLLCIRADLKDSQYVPGTERIVEVIERQSSDKASASHNDEVPVVRVAEEEGVLVGVDQVEYCQSHNLTEEDDTHQSLW